MLEQVRAQHPELRLTVGLGSLGVNDLKPLSDKARTVIDEHWRHVTELSGQPFDHDVLKRPDLTYDTKPASQALMLVRQAYPALSQAFLVRLGERFFLHGLDLTSPANLADIVAEFGLDRVEIEAALRANKLAPELLIEWQQTEKLGITGYPTLLALANGQVEVITIGWCDAASLLKKLSA